MKKSVETIIQHLLKNILWFIIRFLVKSYRIEVRNDHFRLEAEQMGPHKTFVFALWHEQVLAVMSGQAWTQPYLALASRSKDGDYAAYVAKKLGFTPVRGSSRNRRGEKGGKEAVIEYITNLKAGKSGGITVDGPKGPRQKCKPGVAYIAQQTGSPILPIAGLASSYWEFNSWDRLKIPKPFARIVMVYGRPISVPSDANDQIIASTCEQVEKSLKELEDIQLNNH